MPQSAWDVILERTTPQHVHGCLVCYEMFDCVLNCTIVEDLELSNGTPHGGYICCSKECAANNDAYLAEAFEGVFAPTRYIEPPPEQLRFTFNNPPEMSDRVTRSIV